MYSPIKNQKPKLKKRIIGFLFIGIMLFLSLGMSGNILKAHADSSAPSISSTGWVKQNAEISWSTNFNPLVWNNAQQTNVYVPGGIGNDGPTVYAYIYDPGSGYPYINLGLAFYHTSQPLNNWQTIDMADSLNADIYHSNYGIQKPYSPTSTSSQTSSLSKSTSVSTNPSISFGITETITPADVQVKDHSDVSNGQISMDWEWQIKLGTTEATNTYNTADYVVLIIPRGDIAPYTNTYCAQRYWIDGQWVCYKWVSQTVYPTIDLRYSESASYQSTADPWALYGGLFPSSIYTNNITEIWSFIPQNPIGVNI